MSLTVAAHPISKVAEDASGLYVLYVFHFLLEFVRRGADKSSRMGVFVLKHSVKLTIFRRKVGSGYGPPNPRQELSSFLNIFVVIAYTCQNSSFLVSVFTVIHGEIPCCFLHCIYTHLLLCVLFFFLLFLNLRIM